jgi:glycine/D-amino acid oxidase-like deaminating enzyme/nitrite reductase/ring-hydroxylating ferredoxin subunit
VRIVRESLWIATTPSTTYPPLEGDTEAEVAVAGGGIVGVVTAYLLAEAGVEVVLIERARIATGVSGHTTAKVTSQHGLRYAELTRRAGSRIARMYADANEAAVAWVAGAGVDCELERAPAYVWAETDREVEQAREEADAARALGLPASFTGDVPLPVPARGAVRFDGQALIHPRKLLLGLADRLVAAGGRVYERTPVLDLDEGEPARLNTASGTVRARRVVLATNMATADRGLFFARAFAYRGYVLAAVLEDTPPSGMFINAGSPTRSVRPARESAEQLLIVGGEGHKTGSVTDTEPRWQMLDRWARERFRLGDVRYTWSTQDFYTPDRRPLVGPLRLGSTSAFVATGFGGWGMSGGVAAAAVLAALVRGHRHPHADVFASLRLPPLLSTRFWSGNLAAVPHLFLDRLTARPVDALEALEPGDGAVVRRGHKVLAVSRDEDGTLRALGAACTHLGCIVSWNSGEQSWDCPCHGSRFATDGTVLHGPAVAPLPSERLEDAP